MMTIPAGFEPHFRKSPATDPWEPLYSRRHENTVQIAFAVGNAHCNSRGFLHGGVLSALCDNAMGLSVAAAAGDAVGGIITVSLALDFLGSAGVGDVVRIEPRVLRAGGSVGFCDALALSGDTIVARASATFRIKRDA